MQLLKMVMRGNPFWRIAEIRIDSRRFALFGLCLIAFDSFAAAPALAQLPTPRFGEVVPRDVREMYDRGLQYLATTQGEKGDWSGDSGGETGPGTTGMALMVFLACGEDPNFGPYSNHVRRSLRNIIERPGFDDGHHGHEHVSPRLRDARPGRSLWRGRRA